MPADAKGESNYWNALHAPIENERLEIVQLLVEFGADLEYVIQDMTPLAHAVEIAIDGTIQSGEDHAPTDIIKFLISAGADPRPGLPIAQHYGWKPIIGLLTGSSPECS
jgi:hypothetical protein